MEVNETNESIRTRIGKYNLIDNKLFCENNSYLGDVFKEVYGDYVYYPGLSMGYLDENGLRGIAYVLETLNKPFNDELKKYFDKQKQEAKKIILEDFNMKDIF